MWGTGVGLELFGFELVGANAVLNAPNDIETHFTFTNTPQDTQAGNCILSLPIPLINLPPLSPHYTNPFFTWISTRTNA